MFIECPRCEAKVDAKVLGEKELDPEGGDPRKVVLLECTLCKSPLLGYTELVQTAARTWDWLGADRLWPDPFEGWHDSIPDDVRRSLQNATSCFKAKVYPATAVMAGRAIEALCKHKVGAGSLARGLSRLRQQELIDDKIFSWASALREQRNLGAHAGETDVTAEDAKDVLDFANAICEYVFVLNEQFNGYMARKGQVP